MPSGQKGTRHSFQSSLSPLIFPLLNVAFIKLIFFVGYDKDLHATQIRLLLAHGRLENLKIASMLEHFG